MKIFNFLKRNLLNTRLPIVGEIYRLKEDNPFKNCLVKVIDLKLNYKNEYWVNYTMLPTSNIFNNETMPLKDFINVYELNKNTMSTHYCIVKKDCKVVSENGYIVSIDGMEMCFMNGEMEDILYTVIGTNRVVRFSIEPLMSNLPLDTPVYALDNITNIKTLRDYLELLKY